MNSGLIPIQHRLRHTFDRSFTLPTRLATALPLPKPLIMVVRAIHCVHFFSREVSYLQRRIHYPELYLPGVFLNQQFGESTFVRAAARVVLISRIIFSTFDESARLVESCKRLKLGFVFWRESNYYVKYRVSQDEWKEQKGYAPDVLFTGWPHAVIGHRLYILIRRMAEVARSLWKISSYMCEFSDAVWIDPHTRARSVDDFFIECRELYEKVSRSEKHLAEVIEANKPMISAALKILKVSWSVEHLASVANSLSNRSDSFQKLLSVPLQQATDFVKNTGQVTKTFFIPTQDRFWKTV